VIQSFAESWALFGTTYLVGLAIAGSLALVGVWIVARDQIFLGAAVAQASTLGVALALRFGAATGAASFVESGAAPTLLAVLASIATAWLAARVAEGRAESQEAVTGWVFLLAGSLPVLLLARSPHGLEEIQRLLFSTLLSASGSDLWLFGGLAAATAAATLAFRERLLVFALDPELAAAIGMRPRLWSGATAIGLGLSVGLSIRAAGTLYTFGCLVLPALLAKNLCREVGPMLWVAPLFSCAAALAGFVLANHLDWPPAHTTVALLAGALPVAWSVRALRRSFEGASSTP
jgi:ABC-type Mn2+/Zn2+ transport system permease subunit